MSLLQEKLRITAGKGLKYVIISAVLLLSCPGISPQEILFKIYPAKSTAVPTGFKVPLEVNSSEFERSFTKNEGLPGYDTMSVKEYLGMYINFRLKVAEAERLGYDTLPSFVSEMTGYRRQLAEPYTRDPDIMERLVSEAYERTIKELNVSHILVSVRDNTNPVDTAYAWNRIMQAYNRIKEGESFDSVALDISDDLTVKDNHGNIGWIYAFLTVYPFEEAAYSTKTGQVSEPFRTSYGYHIVKINDERHAGGEIRLAHIMTVADVSSDSAAIVKAGENIRKYYEMLKNGKEFGEVARVYSEDASTAANNGLMQWLRTGDLPPDIEKAVFALTDSCSFTEPLRSVYGWHLFQLKDKRPFGSQDGMRDQLIEKIISSGRAEIAEKTILEKLQKKFGLEANNNMIPEDMADSLLEIEFPDLKEILNEYHEGILLFNISNEHVWQKAADDTAGLENFFEGHINDYAGKEFGEVRGTVIAAYQDYLEKEWIAELKDRYRVSINKKELRKVMEKYEADSSPF
jgi:peptidyl-prolyl cis-trans isomerase SurA